MKTNPMLNHENAGSGLPAKVVITYPLEIEAEDRMAVQSAVSNPRCDVCLQLSKDYAELAHLSAKLLAAYDNMRKWVEVCYENNDTSQLKHALNGDEAKFIDDEDGHR